MATTFHHNSPPFSFRIHEAWTMLLTVARRPFTALHRYKNYLRTINDLNTRSNHVLDDMGIGRNSIRAFALKAHYGPVKEPSSLQS